MLPYNPLSAVSWKLIKMSSMSYRVLKSWWFFFNENVGLPAKIYTIYVTFVERGTFEFYGCVFIQGVLFNYHIVEEECVVNNGD